MDDDMDVYEREQLQQLRQWQQRGPDIGTRLLSRPSAGAAKVVQTLIPVGVLRSALKSFNKAAQWLGGPRGILRRAGVDTLDDLRAQPLQTCDRLARFEDRSSMGYAGASGAALGLAGAAGMVVDVPTLITQAMRVIHRTGLCYGEDMLAEQHQGLAIGIFALASANTMEEKQQALIALSTRDEMLDAAWRDGVERAAERELAKEAAVFSLQTLASRISARLARRMAAGSLPVLGAAVGAAVNAWYIHDVALTARYVFQERWLKAHYPQAFTAPAPLPPA